MKKIKLLILGFLLSTVLVCGGCSNDNSIQNTANGEQADTQNKPSEEENKDEKDKQQEVDKKEENAYINDCLICGRSEASVKSKFEIPRRAFDVIKDSAIVRFGIVFNIIVYK